MYENFSSFQLLWQNDNGFSANINNVKLDLFNWRVKFIYPPVIEDGLRMMSQQEIGAMKLEAITDRKTQKDFTDLYYLLQTFSLSKLLDSFRIKYPCIDHKFVLESLSLIDEADSSEAPLVLEPLSWLDTKAYLLSCLKTYWQDLNTKVVEK